MWFCQQGNGRGPHSMAGEKIKCSILSLLESTKGIIEVEHTGLKAILAAFFFLFVMKMNKYFEDLRYKVSQMPFKRAQCFY